jgi:hypothetical protein
MKSPIKDQNNKFICEECNRTFAKKDGLSKHISINHMSKKEYYDKYFKNEGEELCPICGNKNPYLNRWDRGYKKTCSYKCANLLRTQSQEITKFKKYGDKRYNNTKQRNKTNIEKYGNKCPTQNFNIHQKIKENNIEKLGVEYPFQSDKIQQKVINKFSQYRRFKDTNVYYNTSYEFDFLEKYYYIFSDIQRGNSIKYTYNKKPTYYLPDFYIPSLNLIVEIKNSYLAKRDKSKIVAKKKATISNGFNYIMITDKRYNKFNKLYANFF